MKSVEKSSEQGQMQGVAAVSTGSDFVTWQRQTIMDGKVVSYAESFSGEGYFPYPKEAEGFFELSASRNTVIVHRADIFSERQLAIFKRALDAAHAKHKELHRASW